MNEISEHEFTDYVYKCLCLAYEIDDINNYDKVNVLSSWYRQQVSDEEYRQQVSNEEYQKKESNNILYVMTLKDPAFWIQKLLRETFIDDIFNQINNITSYIDMTTYDVQKFIIFKKKNTNYNIDKFSYTYIKTFFDYKEIMDMIFANQTDNNICFPNDVYECVMNDIIVEEEKEVGNKEDEKRERKERDDMEKEENMLKEQLKKENVFEYHEKYGITEIEKTSLLLTRQVNIANIKQKINEIRKISHNEILCKDMLKDIDKNKNEIKMIENFKILDDPINDMMKNITTICNDFVKKINLTPFNDETLLK